MSSELQEGKLKFLEKRPLVPRSEADSRILTEHTLYARHCSMARDTALNKAKVLSFSQGREEQKTNIQINI